MWDGKNLQSIYTASLLSSSILDLTAIPSGWGPYSGNALLVRVKDLWSVAQSRSLPQASTGSQVSQSGMNTFYNGFLYSFIWGVGVVRYDASNFNSSQVIINITTLFSFDNSTGKGGCVVAMDSGYSGYFTPAFKMLANGSSLFFYCPALLPGANGTRLFYDLIQRFDGVDTATSQSLLTDSVVVFQQIQDGQKALRDFDFATDGSSFLLLYAFIQQDMSITTRLDKYAYSQDQMTFVSTTNFDQIFYGSCMCTGKPIYALQGSCTTPPPYFPTPPVCVNGTWVFNESVSAFGTANITQGVIVLGGINLPENSTIVFSNGSLLVEGCASVNGNILVNPNGLSHSNSEFNVTVINSTNNCLTTGSTLTVGVTNSSACVASKSATSSSLTITVTYSCENIGLIAGVVVGGVVFLAIVVIVIALLISRHYVPRSMKRAAAVLVANNLRKAKEKQLFDSQTNSGESSQESPKVIKSSRMDGL